MTHVYRYLFSTYGVRIRRRANQESHFMIYSEKSHAGSKGFTLIEIMIAIAIVAILIVMAVPAYHDYTIRAKIAECINGASVAKVSISEYRQALGAWPSDVDQAGLALSNVSQYCSGLINYQPTTGTFTIDINEATIDAALAADSIFIEMEPTPTGGNNILWNCGKSTTSPGSVKYLPATCRDS